MSKNLHGSLDQNAEMAINERLAEFVLGRHILAGGNVALYRIVIRL